MDIKDLLEYEKMVKFNLPESERAWIIEKANMLDNSFNKLSSVDTQGIEPLISPLELQNSLREDVANKAFSRDEILSNSPEQCDGYFQVPKTIE